MIIVLSICSVIAFVFFVFAIIKYIEMESLKIVRRNPEVFFINQFLYDKENQ